MVRDLSYGIRNILNRNLGLALTVLHGFYLFIYFLCQM